MLYGLSAQKKPAKPVTVKMLFAILSLFALAGCSGGAVQEDKIVEKFGKVGTFSAVVDAELDHGDHLTVYKLEYFYSAGEGHVITVAEPAELTGLITRVGDEGLEIEYEGVIVAPEFLEGTAVSPVKLLPALYKSWSEGLADSVYAEKENDMSMTVLNIYAKVDREEILFRTWFSGEDPEPVRAEAFAGGNRIFRCSFAEVEITLKD